ncbi:MAG: hypothetical protein R3E02_01855 [Blastomonas sp.]
MALDDLPVKLDCAGARLAGFLRPVLHRLNIWLDQRGNAQCLCPLALLDLVPLGLVTALPVISTALGWITAAVNLNAKPSGFLARLFGRDGAMLPNSDAPGRGAATASPILKQVNLFPRWRDLKPKSRKFGVPDQQNFATGPGVINGSFCEFPDWHSGLKISLSASTW